MPALFRAAVGAPKNLEDELRSLERQAANASQGYETQFLNRAGYLCAQAGEMTRAMKYFGRAIDAYLETGRFSAAEVACRRLLDVAPDAVRTRGTLAWLSLGKGYLNGTEEAVRAYVEAARKTNTENLAVKQLIMMAEAAANSELREMLGEQLLSLGDDEAAERVFGQVYQERNGLRPERVQDAGKLWARLLRAALMGPERLREEWNPLEDTEDGEAGAETLPSLIQSAA